MTILEAKDRELFVSRNWTIFWIPYSTESCSMYFKWCASYLKTMARFVCLFPFHHLRVENDLAVVCLANNTDIIFVTYFSRAQVVGIFILRLFLQSAVVNFEKQFSNVFSICVQDGAWLARNFPSVWPVMTVIFAVRCSSMSHDMLEYPVQQRPV